MMRDVLGENRVGVNAMLGRQRAFDPIGKGVMQELGSAMDGAGVVRLARGGMKTQLLEGADVVRARGVVDSQLLAGVDVAGMTRGVVKSHELLNRPGLRDMVRGIDAGAGRLALRSGAARASGATSGLLAARALSGQVGQDITRWTPPSARESLRRVGAGARFAGVGQPLAHVWRDAGGDLHGALMRGYPKLHQVIAAAAGPRVRDLHGLNVLGLAGAEFGALNHLVRRAVGQTHWAEGLTSANHAALRDLMAATVDRAPAWTAAYGGGSALQRLVRDAAARSGLGVTGVDAMRGRGIWDGAGVVRLHNALVGARSPWADARLAHLSGPGGAWAAADDETPTEAELFVPGPGDTLDAVGADIVLDDAHDGELVPVRRLDIAWEWLCANPGHWVRALRIVWPDASVHQRNTLRRQAAAIGLAHLLVLDAWTTASTLGVVGALCVLGLAWQTLFHELSKLLSERDEQR